MSKSTSQYEKEIKKLKLSNKALKKEAAWFKSWVNRLYPSVIFLIASLIYFLLNENDSLTSSIFQSILYTVLFIIADLFFGRIFRLIWQKRQDI